MKNSIRLLISGFMVLLILSTAVGIHWWSQEGPKPSPDGRPALAVGIVAGLFGLWMLWADSMRRRGRG